MKEELLNKIKEQIKLEILYYEMLGVTQSIKEIE